MTCLLFFMSNVQVYLYVHREFMYVYIVYLQMHRCHREKKERIILFDWEICTNNKRLLFWDVAYTVILINHLSKNLVIEP